MVYAYDQNIQYPVKDLYDNQIIAMSIAAAKDMYEKGQQEIKDFQKEYGDFYSPFAKDMARYGQIIGGVKDVINNLYANGIDPIRSAEGRAAVSRAIASVDPSEINNMRANAKIGYAYLDALQRLNSQGKYDPNMQNAYLRSQGLPTFEDFSSEGGNSWTQSSPMEAITLRDLTSPGFAHRTAHELTKEQAMREMGASYDPRAKYMGFTYDDLFDTAGTLVPGLRGDWRAEYFRDISAQKALARNPNATQADIDRQFQADVAEANRHWIIEPTGKLDDYYHEAGLQLDRQKLGLEAAKMAQAQRNADRSYQLELLKNGIGIDPKTGKFVAIRLPGQGNTGEYVQPVDQRQIDKNVKNKADALGHYGELFQELLRQNQKTIDDYEKEKRASTIGYREEKTPATKISKYPSAVGGVIPQFGNTSGTITKKIPYIKNASSDERLAKLKKNADTAKYNVREIQKILSGGVEQLQRRGYLDNNGFPTEKYTKLMTKTYLNKSRMAALSPEQRKQTVNGVFNSLYSAGDLAKGDFKNWRDSQFASGNLETLPGTKDKKMTSVYTGEYTYAPVYKNAALGIKMGESSMEIRINNWLTNNIPAWDFASKKQDYFLPGISGEKYATEGPLLISEQSLREFAKLYGYSVDDVVKKQNLRRHSYNKEGSPYSTVYYELPVFKDLSNNGGFNYYRINESVNKSDFESAQSAKDREDAQRQSVMN